LLAGLALLAGFVAIALFALARWGADVTNLPSTLLLDTLGGPASPSLAHPFGTLWIQYAGGPGPAVEEVDLLGALVRATPIDLALVGGPVLLALLIGSMAGAYAGYTRGWVDLVILGIADIIGAVPSFLLIWVLYFGILEWVPGPWSLTLFGGLLVAILWPAYAYPVRAQAQEVSRSSYVESARAAGGSDRHILRRHLIPNSIGPALSQAPFDVYSVFFILTLFPYLNCSGLLPSPSQSILAPLSELPTPVFPEWGNLFANGVCSGWSVLNQLNYWWMYTFPLIAIVTFGMSIALLCDGLGKYLAGRQGGGILVRHIGPGDALTPGRRWGWGRS
jgi:ABC-type dipeptide/oligopeptide/nickel transport system permease subunit